MSDDRKDPKPTPPPPKRPQPDTLKKQGKALTEPARPEPDRLTRVQEGRYRGGDDQ